MSDDRVVAPFLGVPSAGALSPLASSTPTPALFEPPSPAPSGRLRPFTSPAKEKGRTTRGWEKDRYRDSAGYWLGDVGITLLIHPFSSIAAFFLIAGPIVAFCRNNYRRVNNLVNYVTTPQRWFTARKERRAAREAFQRLSENQVTAGTRHRAQMDLITNPTEANRTTALKSTETAFREAFTTSRAVTPEAARASFLRLEGKLGSNNMRALLGFNSQNPPPAHPVLMAALVKLDAELAKNNVPMGTAVSLTAPAAAYIAVIRDSQDGVEPFNAASVPWPAGDTTSGALMTASLASISEAKTAAYAAPAISSGASSPAPLTPARSAATSLAPSLVLGG